MGRFGPLGALLEALLSHLGGLLALGALRLSWGSQGCSEAVLGASWAVSGASGAVPGPCGS
eukprot:3734260-Pyramimonas_sp.AAC.1